MFISYDKYSNRDVNLMHCYLVMQAIMQTLFL